MKTFLKAFWPPLAAVVLGFVVFALIVQMKKDGDNYTISLKSKAA